jgi:hypothetical protein
MKEPGERKETEEREDYVWRFRLDAGPAPGAEEDPMVEMIRTFLAGFLQLGFLTKDGVRVDADGFAFVAKADTVHKIFPSKEV